MLDTLKIIELDTSEGLELIGNEEFELAITKGDISQEYTRCVEHLTKELKIIYCLDEYVNAISSNDDISSFKIEVGSFLKELGCEYKMMMQGNLNERLNTKEEKLQLLDFLINEILGGRINHSKPKKKNLLLTINESRTAAALKNIIITLKLPRPAPNDTISSIFDKITNQITQQGLTPSEPLFTGKLSETQWKTVENVYNDLQIEYKTRRLMLLKRLDWSDKMKGRENDFAKLYCEKRNKLLATPSVKLSDVLAARIHLAIMEKTSSARVRANTKSSVNTYLIGQVPDRGGRPQDQQPPPPEMPSWAPRAQGGDQRGGRGGFRGSGRVQGGWNSDQGGGQDNFNDQRRGGHGSGGYQGRGGRGRGRGRGY